MEGLAGVVILIVSLFIALYLTNIYNPINLLTFISTPQIADFFKRADLFLATALIIDLLILSFAKLLLKR